MKILMIAGGSKDTPSTHQRIYETAPFLKAQGTQPKILPLWGGSGFVPKRVQRGFWWLRMMRGAAISDVVFVQKLPLSISEIDLLKDVNDRIVFSFDDAWHARPRGKEWVEAEVDLVRKRLEHMIRSSGVVIVPNRFLTEYAFQFNSNTKTIPVPVSCQRFQPSPRQEDTEDLVIGWVGRPWTAVLSYLKMLSSPLQRLSSKHRVTLRLLGLSKSNEIRAYFAKDRGFEVDFIPWVEDEEVPGIIAGFDIAVMPMTDDDWSQGKFPLKSLEYMATGIPMVCSPVGIDTQVMQDGSNCMLADTEESWYKKLSLLADDATLRKLMGQEARETAEQHYSLEVVTTALIKECNALL